MLVALHGFSDLITSYAGEVDFVLECYSQGFGCNPLVAVWKLFEFRYQGTHCGTNQNLVLTQPTDRDIYPHGQILPSVVISL